MFTKLVVFSLLVTFSATNECLGNNCVVNKNARMIGGVISEANSRPFQVALLLRVGVNGEQGFCGGALVHPEWVLTAAHCCFHDDQQVDNVQTILYTYAKFHENPFGRLNIHLNFRIYDAVLGAHSLYDRYENGRRIVNVEEVIPHPDFEPHTFANDIALVKLANTIQLTDTIDTVRLPYLRISTYNFAGMGAIASGWGIAAEGVTFVSPTLREKLMTVMTDPLCNTSYFGQLPANTVCGYSGLAGTCKGDNGGPFTIVYNATEETILIGVASFVGAGGCSDDVPSVFTRVQRYLTWISDVTGIVID